MSFIQRELEQIRTALGACDNDSERDRLYIAQQALSWALEPSGCASPYAVISGTAADSGGCSVPPRH